MKREIDKAKKERAAEKRERRQRSGATEDSPATDDGVAAVAPPPRPSSMPNDEVLLQLERLHAQFDAHELEFEAFERAKESLLAQLATE
jgi:hypothetical protein